jgi:hypothetical protein
LFVFDGPTVGWGASLDPTTWKKSLDLLPREMLECLHSKKVAGKFNGLIVAAALIPVLSQGRDVQG